MQHEQNIQDALITVELFIGIPILLILLVGLAGLLMYGWEKISSHKNDSK